MTERDGATGLDHTWFRKNENRAGRWTSPDPYNGSMSLGDPQSFNRYSYVTNQPTNFVDPSGLLAAAVCYTYVYGKEYRFEDGTVIRIREGTRTICIGGGSPTYSHGGGWVGGAGSLGGILPQTADEKQYIRCATAVEKKYKNLAMPANYSEYAKQRDRLREDINKRFAGSLELSVTDLIILGSSIRGGVPGLLLGIAGVGVKTLIESNQIQEDWEIGVRRLEEDFTQGFNYDKQMGYKDAELNDCEKYLKRGT